jgi:hypothetical protein
VSRFSRKCEISDITQPYGHPWPVTGLDLLTFTCFNTLSTILFVLINFIQHKTNEQYVLSIEGYAYTVGKNLKISTLMS